MRRLLTVLLMTAALAGPGSTFAQPPAPPAAAPRTDITRVEGRMPNGNQWAAELPAKWNGTLLLESHGYSPVLRPPGVAPRGLRDWLLDRGYALAGSSFSKAGWALEEAVPDQIATLDAFQQKFGKPKRTIAWGGSMGALASIALVERHPERIDAAIAYCGSISGSLGMMNMALDGAFAFKTLAAPASNLQLQGVTDDNANAALARDLVQKAQATPEGRARLALAGVFAQLPVWSDQRAGEPAATDFDAQQSQAASTFVVGVIFPRVDQEARAGGPFSWNTGVDYRRQLTLSGRRPYVEALYRKAGLDLDKDLEALAAAPRVSGDPAAIGYMRANYVPSGRLERPVFSFHTIGDGMTMPTKQAAYGDAVKAAGRASMFASGWVRRAGHCTFTPAETAASLLVVESRLESGLWDASPESLNARARASGLGEAAFTAFAPAPFLRPCTARQRYCQGEPRSRPRQPATTSR